MRLLRSLRIFILLFVALFAGVPQAAFAWQCEGRDCGVKPWVCCCEAHSQLHGTTCKRPAYSHTRGVGAAECECVMTIRSADGLGAPSFVAPPLPAYQVDLLAPALPDYTLIPCRTTFTPSESRGPPLRDLGTAPAALRAPPFRRSTLLGS